ncbi:unnamed protein product [Effrenium voratum]|uniref:Uncharacterized protein n=1 Tax=Effrenium voratum TaxID=2562239 RepID=A0AA36I1N6_9DINO|nr:unnamed protein product [Effrenium voratum]CAJ1426355.1 unnamed protein product [Effrenium voratum]
MSTGGIPSLAELQMHGRHIKEAIDEQPPPVRWSWYLGPTGTLVLLICILTASSTAACKDHCVRVGDALEDRLLRCMDRCEVTTAKAGTCEKQCHSQVHYTRRQVQREQEDCSCLGSHVDSC